MLGRVLLEEIWMVHAFGVTFHRERPPREMRLKHRRDVNDVRRGLWEPFLRVVEEIRPKAVLMENVPDMALGDDLIMLRTIITRLEAAGYDITEAPTEFAPVPGMGWMFVADPDGNSIEFFGTL